MAKNNLLTVRKGRCINFGNCPNADSKEVQEVNLGDDFVCSNSDCGCDLQEIVAPPDLKKIAIIAVIVVALCFCAYMLFRPGPEITASIEPASAIVGVDETFRLTVKTEPEDAGKRLKWSWASSDESIATVSRNGVVSGLLAGNATITVSSEKDKSISATASVVVQALPAPPEPVIEPIQPEKPTQPRTPSTGTSVKTYSFGKYEGALLNGIPHGRGTMSYTCRVQIAKREGRNSDFFAERGDSFTGTWHNGDIEHGNLYDSSNNIKFVINVGRRPSAYNLANDRCE